MGLAESLDWFRLQSDFERRTTAICKRGCCWNPYGICGRNNQCACHGEVS